MLGGHLFAQVGHRLVRLGAGNLQQRTEATGVGALALLQACGKQRQQVRDIGEALAGLEVFAGREVFQVQRDVVRQLLDADGKARVFVLGEHVDHGLAAVAGLAMHMLEQQQRQRTATAEQRAVVFLAIHQVVVADQLQQLEQGAALARADFPRLDDRLLQLVAAGNQGFARVIEQQRNHFKDAHAHSSHSCTVLRMSRRLAFFAPNMLVSELPLQPLPKLKPQPERSAKASLMASSRCALGTT
ncbi:hypothetical protein D3C78_632820 [compost metagenome]